MSDTPSTLPTDSAPVVADAAPDRLRYRLLAGPDTRALCERVSEALADGYVLYGSPALTFDGTTTYAAQAVVLPAEVA